MPCGAMVMRSILVMVYPTRINTMKRVRFSARQALQPLSAANLLRHLMGSCMTPRCFCMAKIVTWIGAPGALDGAVGIHLPRLPITGEAGLTILNGLMPLLI